MKIINYFSTAAIPVIIAIIILYGVIERKKVYDIFLKGAKDGIKIVFQLIPTLIVISSRYVKLWSVVPVL